MPEGLRRGFEPRAPDGVDVAEGDGWEGQGAESQLDGGVLGVGVEDVEEVVEVAGEQEEAQDKQHGPDKLRPRRLGRADVRHTLHRRAVRKPAQHFVRPSFKEKVRKQNKQTKTGPFSVPVY